MGKAMQAMKSTPAKGKVKKPLGKGSPSSSSKSPLGKGNSKVAVGLAGSDLLELLCSTERIPPLS